MKFLNTSAVEGKMRNLDLEKNLKPQTSFLQAEGVKVQILIKLLSFLGTKTDSSSLASALCCLYNHNFGVKWDCLHTEPGFSLSEQEFFWFETFVDEDLIKYNGSAFLTSSMV